MASNPENFFPLTALLNDFKEIDFTNPQKNPAEKAKKVKPGEPIQISNHVLIKSEELINDFDLFDLGSIYLLAILCQNSILIHSFNKHTQKLTLERKQIFDTANNNKTQESENLYAVAFGTVNFGQELVLVSGGSFGFLYLIYIEEESKVKELVSNNGDIMIVTFAPEVVLENHAWVLAGYKNGYSILWDLDVCQQVARFRNFNQNPQSDVFGLDWHASGGFFVASHNDTRVIVWEVDSELFKRKENKGRTLEKTVPLKETFDPHSNYVDCVKFWGDLIITKDVEGNILLWTPYKETIFIINVYGYDFYEPIWFVKFTLNSKMESFCLGNDNGEVFVYRIREGAFTNQYDPDKEITKKYFNICKEGYYMKFKLTEEKVIRKAVITEDESFFFCISDGGKFWWKRINN